MRYEIQWRADPYLGYRCQQKLSYSVRVADTDFIVGYSNKMTWGGRVSIKACHDYSGLDTPCLSCNSTIRRFWSPTNIRMRCHNRVNDARKGPGTSLIERKYLRHTIIAMATKRAWAQMRGHEMAAVKDSIRAKVGGNENDVIFTATQLMV